MSTQTSDVPGRRAYTFYALELSGREPPYATLLIEVREGASHDSIRVRVYSSWTSALADQPLERQRAGIRTFPLRDNTTRGGGGQFGPGLGCGLEVSMRLLSAHHNCSTPGPFVITPQAAPNHRPLQIRMVNFPLTRQNRLPSVWHVPPIDRFTKHCSSHIRVLLQYSGYSHTIRFLP